MYLRTTMMMMTTTIVKTTPAAKTPPATAATLTSLAISLLPVAGRVDVVDVVVWVVVMVVEGLGSGVVRADVVAVKRENQIKTLNKTQTKKDKRG
jgi:hypothetical protein